MKSALVIACLCACSRRQPITSCEQDLTGEYVSGSGENHWMLQDHGDTLEAFPLFPDVPASELEVAPRAIEWRRDGTNLRGRVMRRFMHSASICVTELPSAIARCNNDVLELTIGDPPAPLGFSPCQQSRSVPTRLERWIRRP